MTETDRKHYCPRTPYVDAPQGIGNGVTISAPHMVCENMKKKSVFCFTQYAEFYYICD